MILVGVVAGALAGWIIARLKSSGHEQNATAFLLVEQEKNKTLAIQLSEIKKQLEAEREKVVELNNTLGAAEADYRNLQEKLTDQKKEIESVSERLGIQFKNLANEIFEEKSRKFTEQNKTHLFDLLQPLGEKIMAFEKRVEDTHKDNISRNSALREQLENLQKLNLQMTREAENLTRALRGDSKAQGAWG